MSGFSSLSYPYTAVRELMVAFAGDQLLIELAVPNSACGVILLAHGNGNVVRRSSMAARLLDFGFVTATCQLLTAGERTNAQAIKRVAIDVPLLAARLAVMSGAIRIEPELAGLPIGIAASGTLAAAALTFASRHPRDAGAIVSRAGRVDLVPQPEDVRCPTLLIAGASDAETIHINDAVFQRLCCTKGYDVLAGAAHRFDDPRTFELVSKLTCDWFLTHLSGGVTA